MAQAYREEGIQETTESQAKQASTPSATTAVQFKFNAQAPEFFPRSQAQQMPVSGYFYPCFHFIGGSGSDWIYVGEQEPIQLITNSSTASRDSSKNYMSNDLRQRIIKQAEYQFSDTSLIANESLAKLINKDPEGYVPISFIASSKKMKSLINNNQMLAAALRASSKLVVSEDGKKIRRKHVLTDRDKEELQSRIVVVENLPEDYSHQNIEKICGAVGSVKAVRICHPQESNASRSSKGDVLISNKLHALVEYETTEQADKAVERLNDERNWRKGLRVRLLLRRSPRAVVKGRKSDYDHLDEHFEDDELPPPPEKLGDTPHQTTDQSENSVDDTANKLKKGWTRGRGKSRGRTQSHSGRGLLAPSPQSSNASQCEAASKQTPRGPRMPDGTRGFTMGRGKPVRLALSASTVD